MRGYTSIPRHLLQRFRMNTQKCSGLIAITQRIKVAETIRAWRLRVLCDWMPIDAHFFSPISSNTQVGNPVRRYRTDAMAMEWVTRAMGKWVKGMESAL